MTPTAPSIAALTAAENSEADERLLRAGRAGARAAVLEGPALSLGVGQTSDAPSARRAQRAGWSVVHRASGGSGVLHLAGDLAWAVVLPRRDARVGRDFARSYDRLGAAPARFLTDLGLTASWGAPRNESESYCLLGSRGQPLEVRGRVVGGAAQHLAGDFLLHHGTIARRVDAALVERLFDVPRATAADLLTGLEEEGVRDPAERLAVRLSDALAEWLGASPG